ncbi:MAG: 50S ribosomal protein L25 [Candidatus Sumerlaeaceae bacterium]|nr:50S ribosomal protein L25 [Candidatus Sumerlaeaceae bacterium]
MQRIDLPVKKRGEQGKGPNRRLRAEGQVPAVLYGAAGEPKKLSIEAHYFQTAILNKGGANALLNINEEGAAAGETVAVLREVQRDPLTRRILHVDLYSIRMDQENEFEIAVHHTGTPVGVREGGILETHLYSVQVRCLPNNLPSAYNIDITGLKINHPFHVSDLPAIEGVKVVSDPELTIFTILPHKKEAEPTPAEGAAEVAQPEVIGKKKAEGEEAPAAGAEKK